ncbi:MAG: alkaline phosphatase family protein [Alphaproteobacteria bacterium]
MQGLKDEAAGRRPGNVLLVTFDQWRADCISALGHPCVRTPTVDSLAADGVLFRNHFTQAAPCGPARASLFTGLYLHNHRSLRNGTPLDDRHPNLAREARKAGYAPKLFGYTDTSADPRLHDPADPVLATYEGVMPGFDAELLLTESLEPWGAWLKARGREVPEKLTDLYLPDRARDVAGRGPTYAPMRMPVEEEITFFVADRVREWLAVNGASPWFLHVSFIRPHPPYVAPAPFNSMVDPADVPPSRRAPTREDQGRQHPWLAAHIERQWRGNLPLAETVPMASLDEAALRQWRATYYGLVSLADAALGRIVDALKSSGLYDDTLIVLTADHGEHLGDHWMHGKDGYHDQAFHIPLVVRDPRAAGDAGRGRVVDAFTEAVDVMPTVLGWLGRPVPPTCDGRSLAPFLAGGEPARWRDAAHWGFDFRDVRGGYFETRLGLAPDECSLLVRRERTRKYVHFAGLPPLLFDLEADPGELVDLSGDPARHADMADCARRLLSWRMAHEDRTLSHLHLGAGGAATNLP